MYTEIIITVQNNEFHQITFINNGFIEFVEPFEMKYHKEHLNNDITEFKFID